MPILAALLAKLIGRLVDTQPEPHLLCSTSSQDAVDLYVDYSSYASVGLDSQPNWGGVCRGSLSHIVNIVGGGGVIPLLIDEVASSLLNARVANVHPGLIR